MKAALITANLGNDDPRRMYVEQDLPENVDLSIIRFTDSNFPPRTAMTPRLQAKIPKILAWQLLPGFDYYIWVDASFSIPHPGAVSFLLEKCKTYDAAFYRHPQRPNGSAKEEADYLKMEILADNPYIVSRYTNERINKEWFNVQGLFAAGVFIYKNTNEVQEMLKDWFFEVAAYHIDDQLSLPYVIKRHGITISVIEENILHNERFVHHRHK